MNEQTKYPEAFREQLLALGAELEDGEASGNADANTVELDQQRQGRLSRMDAINAQAMTRAARRRCQETLRRCDEALARIGRGDFGLCSECDDPIGSGRLAADATVCLCIRCASQGEQ